MDRNDHYRYSKNTIYEARAQRVIHFYPRSLFRFGYIIAICFDSPSKFQIIEPQQ